MTKIAFWFFANICRLCWRNQTENGRCTISAQKLSCGVEINALREILEQGSQGNGRPDVLVELLVPVPHKNDGDYHLPYLVWLNADLCKLALNQISF